MQCNLCPHECGVDRNFTLGFCQATNTMKIARASLHHWEEPCISGKNGSGTIFFSCCTLKCCFCQNYKISCENFGEEISIEKLSDIMLSLEQKGAHNINLVTATHYVDKVIKALDLCRHKLNIPIVFNCGGYEKVDTIKMLDGYIDMFLPDFKYFDDKLAIKYSNAPNYFMTATNAIKQMFKQTGKYKIKNNLMTSGVIIRHLVLPTHRKDSFAVLDWIAKNFNNDDVLLSLMSQYTPYRENLDFPELNRKISTFEYNKVVDHALTLGINGFMQERSSAKEEYTPNFDLSGI